MHTQRERDNRWKGGERERAGRATANLESQEFTVPIASGLTLLPRLYG